MVHDINVETRLCLRAIVAEAFILNVPSLAFTPLTPAASLAPWYEAMPASEQTTLRTIQERLSPVSTVWESWSTLYLGHARCSTFFRRHLWHALVRVPARSSVRGSIVATVATTGGVVAVVVMLVQVLVPPPTLPCFTFAAHARRAVVLFRAPAVRVGRRG